MADAQQAAGCEPALASFCAKDCSPKLGGAATYARFGRGRDPSEPIGWRCYSASALTADQRAYASERASDAYCTRHDQMQAVIDRCQLNRQPRFTNFEEASASRRPLVRTRFFQRRRRAWWPELVTWGGACHGVRRMNPSREHLQAPLIDLVLPNTPTASLDTAVNRDAAFETGLDRLRADLAGRGVLCDKTQPCNVTGVGLLVTICLPPAARGALVCEPWGQGWQQLGSRAPGFHCLQIDLRQVAAWRQEVRSPFLSWRDRAPDGSESDFEASLARKAESVLRSAEGQRGGRKLPRRRSAPARSWPDRSSARARQVLAAAQHTERAAALKEILDHGRLGTIAPRSYGSCAVVGSGHDLRCGEPKGKEIDAHDAVFRANGWGLARGDAKLRALAGSRTDFRVNCLHDDRLPQRARREACIVNLRWFDAAWGNETVNDARHFCCEPQSRNTYSIERLLELSRSGFRFGFVRPPTRQERDDATKVSRRSRTALVDRLLRNSGGHAMHVALSLCRRVDVYGVGLFSIGPAAEKIYAHFYDPGLGVCAHTDGVAGGGSDGESTLNSDWKRAWLEERLANELVMHTLHAFDLVHWVQ